MRQEICCFMVRKHVKLHYEGDEEHSIVIRLKIRQRRFEHEKEVSQ
ncbi:hypothetical protein GQ588_00595 [Dehalobacter restrictus]|uniref:Uncharacterized protein n=1 Tax=Dehalobacter restrictus TaxID=55583 RepID=A0A857DFJ0_9FIRM|nr:hypothetical protein GQ588_00595 [Dehalobacter restrictus]